MGSPNSCDLFRDVCPRRIRRQAEADEPAHRRPQDLPGTSGPELFSLRIQVGYTLGQKSLRLQAWQYQSYELPTDRLDKVPKLFWANLTSNAVSYYGS